MTTATLDRAATPNRTEGRYGFRTVAQMEWIKLRSVRSTWWTLLVFAAAMVGLAIHRDRLGHDVSDEPARPSTRPTTASPGWPSASSPSASSACWR